MRKCLLPVIGLLLSLVFPVIPAAAQDVETCRLAEMLVKTAEKHHYDPRPVDDQFSRFAFTAFMDLLDPEKTLLNQEEADELERFRELIDDEIEAGRCELPKITADIYSEKLRLADSLLNAFQDVKFNFDIRDTLSLKRDHYPENKAAQETLWKQRLKYRVLRAYSLESDSFSVEDFNGRSVRLISRMIEREKCKIAERLEHPEGIRRSVGDIYLKSLASAFDPHTAFYRAREKTEFTADLSRETGSFGIRPDKNDEGEIIVGDIVPGSSAWNSNKLNHGDVILSVKADNGILREFDCLSLSDAAYFLSDPTVKKADFHVRKYNGAKINLTLLKEKLEVEDNVIKSFVLNGDRKLGYINLPSFYTEPDHHDYMTAGCAHDMAKELIRLKNEGTGGLIIDLRNNGGGSMLEALLTAGIFIDYGALAIQHVRGEAPVTLKDMNRGTGYGDPVLVLVNAYSASASELFAGALQDHNRVIVAGSKTYGKATGQMIVPVDAYLDNELIERTSKTGTYLKLTTSTLYRVDGTNHQKTGVIPDIELPGFYDQRNIGESGKEAALEPAEIDKKTYYKPLDPIPADTLKALSVRRVAAKTDFIELEKAVQLYAETVSDYKVPLSYEDFTAFIEDLESKSISHDVNNELFTVNNPAYRAGISSFSETGGEIDETVIEDIRTDPYIIECYEILNDYIELTDK